MLNGDDVGGRTRRCIELSPPSGATLTTPIGPVLSVIVGDRSVRLITREDGVDLATVDKPDGQVAAGVKARFDAKPIDRVVIYVPDDTSFARFGDVLAAVASVAGNDREPPILLSVLPERPKPEDLDAGIVKGRLPPEVIQRIVRQNFGELRTCYEKGLAKKPKLEGRVVVTFTIERDGTVKTARGGGDLPDPSVRSCVAKQIAELNFPVPDGGVVQVSYPVVFAPR